MSEKKKIALVHDLLLYPGGAERTLRVLADMYPEAPIYTILYNKEAMKGMFDDRAVYVSGLRRMPQFLQKRHRYLLPFMPTMPETFDLREFDVVLSSSGAWSKGIVTRLDTTHVAYLHSPMRFVWDYNERYAAQARGKEPSLLLRGLLSYLRLWDYQAAQRPDILISNSEYTKRRVQKYYGRESNVIYPPAWDESLGINKEEKDIQTRPAPLHPSGQNYFLIVSRLSAYKNVMLAVDVCSKLNLPLVVIGQGEQLSELQKHAGSSVHFCGYVSDEKRDEYYRQARAFIFPSEDDFGMTIVEAHAYGIPVIAYSRGGASEIVEPGVTGELFREPTSEVCADAIRRFLNSEKDYAKDVIRERAKRFSRSAFTKKIGAIVQEYM